MGKTKLKMGRHNPVTAERFKLIKAALAGGMSDEGVMRRYEIKRTTLSYIKRSVTFYEYRLLTETLPAARKMPTVVEPNSGVAYEDYSMARKRKSANGASKGNGDDPYILGVIVVAVAALVVVGIVACVKIWAKN